MGRYGNIANVQTTGASSVTASQDRIPYAGVPASRKLANTDLSAMSKYRSWIQQAGSQAGVDSAVIAGILSRETRAGKVIGPNGYGADGHGYGIMQVDDRYHTLQGGAFSFENIKQGVGILTYMIDTVRSKHPNWTVEMALKGGICAYNGGASIVDSYETMDARTTGGDYSNDVTARAQFFKENGY